MDEKRPLLGSASLWPTAHRSSSLWRTAHRGPFGFQDHLRETGSEVMSSTDPRKDVVGLQDDRFDRYATDDHAGSYSNVGCAACCTHMPCRCRDSCPAYSRHSECTLRPWCDTRDGRGETCCRHSLLWPAPGSGRLGRRSPGQGRQGHPRRGCQQWSCPFWRYSVAVRKIGCIRNGTES